MNGLPPGVTSCAPLLATTALEQTWGTNERLVFLGEWCRRYDRRHVWSQRPHSVVRNHWDDRAKLRSDHDYLKCLHDSVLAELVRAMNRYHRIDRPVRYWQMVLDPWLLTYVAVIWDRWECLRVAFEQHGQLETIAPASHTERAPFLDYRDFVEKILSDEWNHDLCRDIIESAFSTQCEVRRLGVESNEPRETARTSPRGPRRSLKHRLAAFTDRLVGKVTPGNQVVFFETYLSPAILTRLHLRLRQVPRWYLDEFAWKAPADVTKSGGAAACRTSLALELKPTRAFEAFLFNRIPSDMPSVYLEGLSSLRNRADEVPLKPKAILTANAHWGNDLFKLWCAEQMLAGTKLITMEHGGCIPPAFSAMSFEEDVADGKTTWAVPFHPKHTRLPASQLCRIKGKSPREYLAVVGFDTSRYNYRVEAAPKAGQSLAHYEMVCDLYASLTDEIKARFVVKPYPHDGWNVRQRLVDRLGEDKISREPKYLRFLSHAKVVVCTYPQTTFAEAMASGLPTILCYPRALWEAMPQFESLLDCLGSVNIVFDDPVAAGAHVNSIWTDPDRWWSSEGVVAARSEVSRQALDLDADWLKRWTAFIQGAIA